MMRDYGFTLMEVIITMTILSMIAVGLSGSIMFGVKARESGMKNIDDLQGLRNIVTMLGSQLKSVLPYKIQSENKDVYAFCGESDSIWFVYSSAGTSQNTVKWVSYYMKQGKFMMSIGLLPDKKLLEKVTDDGQFADFGINKINFQYLSEKDDWENQWKLSDSLPKAVRTKINDKETFEIYIPVWAKKEEVTEEGKLPQVVVTK